MFKDTLTTNNAEKSTVTFKKAYIFQLLFLVLSSCVQGQKVNKYPDHVGDIAFDPKLDEIGFEVCDEKNVFQYYNFGKGVQYKGEKISINDHFFGESKLKGAMDDTGFITIRFIVNCKGSIGRFRVQSMDNDYKEKVFSDGLINQLVLLTKNMEGWVIAEYESRTFDYYQYLTFKFNKGQLVEIMP